MFFLSDPESNYGMMESLDLYETYGPWVLSILASFLHQYYVKAPLIERRISMRQNAVICAEFWPNGRIKSFGLIKHGKWHGPVQGFWDNGELDYRQNFNEGITDGPYEFFFLMADWKKSEVLTEATILVLLKVSRPMASSAKDPCTRVEVCRDSGPSNMKRLP